MKLSIISLLILITYFYISFSCEGAEKLLKKSIAVMEPGIGIGNIEIGDKLQEVIKKMAKKPSDGKKVKIGNITEYWFDYADMGITFIFDGKETLSRIAVSNPSIIVHRKDIKVNSSLTDLERIYGRGIIKELNEKYDQWSYPGISFTINKDTKKIEVITIEKVAVIKEKVIKEKVIEKK